MTTRRISVAALLAFGSCGLINTAQAIPISLEFSGFVNQAYRFNSTGMATPDTAVVGMTVQGLFVIETEGLVRTTSTTAGYDALNYSDANDAVDLISSQLFIGGVSYEPSGYVHDVGTIQFYDSKGQVSCGTGCSSTTPDQFLIRDVSSEVPTVNGLPFPPAQPFPAPGTYHSRQFTFNSAEQTDPFNPLGSGNYIDLTQNILPLDVVNLPLALIGSGYSEFEFVCTNVCRQNSWRTMGFTITSLTRSASVPEPATFGLLTVGLAGIVLRRKRRKLPV